ncbi:type IV pilus twitching motility protein PilT [Acidithiobacillus ferridurans]|uniref:Flp pilus assembly complex ATPase component TadA n=1 Tax=Acidithiobacillus ferridurans TaxID=1232575 RepID=A0A8X8GDA1_ACIFI|nr:ATPase, T2SS/T4P/T4SS family [Acidithiobacillus ferridurans]MBU2723811.1 Flp pilus assembly complex ATPase component TadA [Acidithiobacillus ferridurans]MBU2725428.1 Flp pilus assembly complex ATPase component TadA [Acidithiobacillus ferridurans]
MSAFVKWFESHGESLPGNWSDLLLKEGRAPKYANQAGLVIPIPDAPIPEHADFELLLKAQTRSDYRFELHHLHGEDGQPRELDFAAQLDGLRFRCNLFHYMGGNLALVMRKLNAHIPEFSTLGLPLDIVLPLFNRSSGILIFSGATGSGKSTTQASGLIAQSHRPIHILTIEDPVEYLLPTDRSAEITQREIGVDSTSFGTALRAALREKPNIIMVGEMRDAETIETAAVAANSGHLVLGTTHAATASESVRRMLESVSEGHRSSLQNLLADAIVGIVSQKLVPNINKDGKVLAYEIMTATPEVRANIRTGRYEALPGVIQQGGADGMMLMEKCLREQVRSGKILEEDAIAYAPDPERLRKMLEY